MSEKMDAEFAEDEDGNPVLIGTDAEGNRRVFAGLKVISITTRDGGPGELIHRGLATSPAPCRWERNEIALAPDPPRGFGWSRLVQLRARSIGQDGTPMWSFALGVHEPIAGSVKESDLAKAPEADPPLDSAPIAGDA